MELWICKVLWHLWQNFDRNDESSQIWQISFRWAIGYVAPVCLLAVPSLSHLHFRLLHRNRQPPEVGFRRHGSNGSGGSDLLRRYIAFSLATLWIDILLRLPAFIHDVAAWTSQPANPHEDVSIDYKFVLHLLTVVLPELKLVYFPLGTFMLLPCRSKKPARLIPDPEIMTKFESGSDAERDSFVVSTSTVAIETVPSLVRIPDSQIGCFEIGQTKKKKKRKRSGSNKPELSQVSPKESIMIHP